MEDNSKSRGREIEALRLIYFQVLDGVTFDEDTGFYIKHFSEQESCLLAQKKIQLVNFYTKEGVPNDAELLKNAIANEEWSEEKENHILFLKQAIADNERNLANLISQQRASVESRIDIDKKELIKITLERGDALGRSVEDLVDDDINEYVAYLSFYKDKQCTELILPTYDIFQSQEVDFFAKLSVSLHKYSQAVNDEAIQTIACMPFFLNKFSYCKDNIYYFLGIPISKLTHHQNYLLSLGARNLATAQHSKGSPPDISTTPSLEEIVKWYNREHALITSRAQSSQNQTSAHRTFKQV